MTRARIGTLVVAVALVVVAGCSAGTGAGGGAGPQPGAAGTRSGAVAVPGPSDLPADVPADAAAAGPVDSVVATGLTTPWGLAFLPDGSALVSERDTALIKRVRPSGALDTVGSVAGVLAEGEGGLLGLAVPPGPNPAYVLAYTTTATDNRVVRLAWDGSSLGTQTTVLTGIPRGPIHDGGRLAFGPDGAVYVSTGEIGEPDRAQDWDDLAGKVLRITPDGRAADGNPVPGSPVFSVGHRNVQGLAFDGRGQLWASEFGAKDVDELNSWCRAATTAGRCTRAPLTTPATSTRWPSGRPRRWPRRAASPCWVTPCTWPACAARSSGRSR